MLTRLQGKFLVGNVSTETLAYDVSYFGGVLLSVGPFQQESAFKLFAVDNFTEHLGNLHLSHHRNEPVDRIRLHKRMIGHMKPRGFTLD